MSELTLSIKRSDAVRCATQHFGAWSIEPKWFRSAMDSVRAGTLKPAKADWDDDDDDDDDGAQTSYSVQNGIALICIDGQMTKRGSSFGGCSTVSTRQAVRSAVNDFSVKGIMIHICSPGGTVAGTADLAEDVAAAGKKKPVDAYIADMGCSAAYWVASQCRQIYANTTALVGSIGTYAMLEDDTSLQEQIGIKYTVVSTGEYKGLGADGSVDDKLVADVQREVTELNASFLSAVVDGRGDNITDLAAVSDGRVHVSAQALKLGLIDKIASLDAAMSALTNEVNPMNADAFKAYAAEHPEAVAGYIEQGKKTGMAEATKSERDRAKAISAACGDNHELAVEAIVLGHDPESAKLAAGAASKATATASTVAKAAADAMAASNAKIAELEEKLAFVTGGQKPAPTRGDGKQEKKDDEKPPTDAEGVAAQAKKDWEANKDGCREAYVDLETFTAVAKRDARVK